MHYNFRAYTVYRDYPIPLIQTDLLWVFIAYYAFESQEIETLKRTKRIC